MGGGVLWALCFARELFIPLAFVALLPLLLLLEEPRRGRRFLLGWLHGTVSWLVGIPWIAHTLEVFGQLPASLSVVLLLGLALYLGLFHALFLLAGRAAWRAGGWIGLAGLPALWVVLEHLRGLLFGGFPWNLAAYAWVEVPGALAASSWIGAPGVSFLVLIPPTALALALRHGWQPRRLGWAAAGLLLPALVLVMAGRWAVPPSGSGAKARSVRLVQPNLSTATEVDWVRIEADYQSVLTQAREACNVPGALVVLPESATWPYVLAPDGPTGPRLQQDLERITALGCPVLVNSVHEEGEGEARKVYNSAFLFGGEGPAQRYDKRHLVPWGEYVPLKDVLPFVGKLARNAGDFTPAKEVRLLSWEKERLGLGICYEMVFPAEVAQAVRAGATLLVTVSNDAWYGQSAARAQHFRAARFRAAESRRPLLRAALNGISALVGADGRIVEELGPDVRGTIAGRVSGRTDLSPFSRRPWLPVAACWILAAFAIVAGWRNDR